MKIRPGTVVLIAVWIVFMSFLVSQCSVRAQEPSQTSEVDALINPNHTTCAEDTLGRFYSYQLMAIDVPGMSGLHVLLWGHLHDLQTEIDDCYTQTLLGTSLYQRDDQGNILGGIFSVDVKGQHPFCWDEQLRVSPSGNIATGWSHNYTDGLRPIEIRLVSCDRHP